MSRIQLFLQVVNSGVSLRARKLDADRPQLWNNLILFHNNGTVERLRGVSPRLGIPLDEEGRVLING